MRRLILSIVALLLLCGCSLPARQGRTPTASASAPAAAATQTAPQSESGRVTASQAVVDLMNRAQKQSNSGDFSNAAATIERALRIEPSNPALWHNLAVNHCRMGDYTQCESTAHRSLSFISPTHPLYAPNWRLIAQSRQLRGDKQGSQEALKQCQ